MRHLKQECIILVIGTLLRAIVLKDPTELDCFISLDVSLGNANCVDAFFAKLVNIALESRTCVLPEHLLKNAQVTLVVNCRSGLKRLEWLDDLHSQPIVLIPNLANDHFVEPLKTPLLEDSQHPIVSNLELIAIWLRELQL